MERFRPDIEGLRAVAVLLVLFYHAGIGLFGGGYVGVDVFFVISGFLITSILIREVHKTGQLDFYRFYTRRILRLLPGSLLVVVTVLLLSILFLPSIRWSSVASDMIWGSLYVINWHLAERSVDYLAFGQAASPLQHYWSLAVEEQFYFFWPVLIFLLARRGKQSETRSTYWVGCGITVLTILSLAYSIYYSLESPERAYFITPTRIWEMAFGGVIAWWGRSSFQIGQRASEALSAFGMLGVIVSALLFDSTTIFPGYAALLPVLSTGMILLAGVGNYRTFVSRFLSISPMMYVGSLSYSLYLWHWPLLIVAKEVFDDLSSLEGLLVVIVSFIPASLSYYWVEKPLRHSQVLLSSRKTVFVLGCVCSLLGVLSGSALNKAASVQINLSGGGPHQGEESLSNRDNNSTEARNDVLRPSPLLARKDIPDAYADGCHLDVETVEPKPCVYGPQDAMKEVLLVGDSHAAMWIPALRVQAERWGFKLKTYTKSACQLANVTLAVGSKKRLYQECLDWQSVVRQEILRHKNSALVILGGSHRPPILDDEGTAVYGDKRELALRDGLAEAWTKLKTTGRNFIVLQDIPYVGVDIPKCLVKHASNMKTCDFERINAMKNNTPHRWAAEKVGFPVVDVNDLICESDICPAVAEDILVWRDEHHLTKTFVESISDDFWKSFNSVAGFF